MSTPTRHQRKRTKGYKMPPGCVSVARPSRWGNRFKVGIHGTAAECVAMFEADLRTDSERLAAVRRELRGKDVACFCPLSDPCHGDSLIRLAAEDEQVLEVNE